jgi:hypothetical protein
MATQSEIDEVKERHSERLMNMPGVVGVGVERDESGQFVLALHVETDDPRVLGGLPRQVEGHPVKIIGGGPYEKFS